MKKFQFCLSIILIISVSIISAGEIKKEKEVKMTKLVIQNFAEDSNLEKAGAMIGDQIINYNGKNVHTVMELNDLKKSTTAAEVQIDLLRGQLLIPVKIPQGQLGVYLKEVMPKHAIEKDAVIIEGIGKLGWGMGMENSFLAAVTLLEAKYGQKLGYNDILGLSGYGFRLQFFDGFCPSSPDATTGKDVGAEILKKLGYRFETYHLKNDDWKEKDLVMKTEDELREIIIKSIDKGWAVIAIDLIEVPEWGIITGYQKNGAEFFCRSYFDKTEGYEIAQKFPWVIFVIEDYKKADISNLYDESFDMAKELYKTEKYDEYFSGLRGVKEWIIDLQDEKAITEAEKEQFAEKKLANWWIYYSLMEARGIAKEYLLTNLDKFGKDKKTIEDLAELYEQEMELLYKNFQSIPSPHIPEKQSVWDKKSRENQIKILQEFLKQEESAFELIKKL